ncbi:hypothetical protein BV898_11339 [Hypsibius exemplaris]|uniref:G-protein coupled receptors family 1 profile domain-containing protein n=1 Tax=Hypsibius exemplaris TaxID=2072580 RepID=A0A1W0WH33_HYPEX|nr:hypothetical protein BV898_11339 [Hypsibius exemplaris]
MNTTVNFTIDLRNSNEQQRNVQSLNLTLQQQSELLAWSVLTSFITLTGVFSCLVLLIATRPKRGSTRGINMLIFHFMAVHLIMCGLCLPGNVITVQMRAQNVTFPPHLCRCVQAIHVTCVSVINWSDAGLALNRFVALFYPHCYKAWTTKWANAGLVILSWLLSLLGLFFIIPGTAGQLTSNAMGLCVYIPAGSLGKAVTFLQYAAYGITGVLAFAILWKTCQRRKMVGQTVINHQNRRITLRRLKMANLLLLTYLWSAVCTLPWVAIVYVGLQRFGGDPVLSLWQRTCLAAQYAVTPCILIVSTGTCFARRSGAVAQRGINLPGMADRRPAGTSQAKVASNIT